MILACTSLSRGATVAEPPSVHSGAPESSVPTELYPPGDRIAGLSVALTARALVALVVTLFAIGRPAAASSSMRSELAACHGLAGSLIDPRRIGEPTSGAIISSAELVGKNAAANADGEYCKVLGEIAPVDRTAPPIRFEVNLPTAWNGKMLQFGGGGLDGVLVTGLGPYSRQPTAEPTPLASGYVTLGSDSGHQSTTPFDGHFYLNEEALENYGHLQIKKTHDVALWLIARRYGRRPLHSYFIGSSQGGHEAFDAAQRYPSDYDGVVAGYPAHNVVMLHLSAWNYARALQAEGGKAWIDPAKARLVASTVYQRCDALDGLTDGIISNLAACEAANADLKRLDDQNPIRCRDGADLGDECLSDAQLRALLAIDRPYEPGFAVFADDAASATFPKWIPFSGSTFRDAGFDILGRDGPQGALQYAPGAATLGLAIARDPTLNVYEHFEPREFQARIRDLALRMSANSTDLDAFRRRGGKMIFFHGLADDFITPYSSIQYFERLQKRYDPRTLDRFVRFYTIPGMGHVTGPFNARMSTLAALEAWVEKSRPPGDLLATDVNPETQGRTRPVCRYPAWPHYLRTGNTDRADNFRCQ